MSARPAVAADPALSASELRARCRQGTFSGHTSGHAYGNVQANLMVVPQEAAFDFLLFCQRNPKPCPLIEVLEAGIPSPQCAPGADIRSDLPSYRVYRDGKLAQETNDIHTFWREDLVSFLIGCSFSFEEALLRAGVPLRHIELGRTVSMYRTKVECQSAGRFHGPLVVSMRPIPASLVPKAVEVTARFARVHGAPVQVGAPEQLGIRDLQQPDYGDPVPIEPGEIPVFWACGVTPQSVALASKSPFCITHAPGRMFVTDLRNDQLL
jgi:uncharacterized protein YcsI (UPF0317 family)